MARINTGKTEQQKTKENEPVKNTDTDQNNSEFPGYPHYSKTEDIMDSRSDAERVNVDVENLPNFHNATTAHRLNPGMEAEGINDTLPVSTEGEMETDLGIEMGTEADVTAEEKKMLDDDMYYPTPDEDSLRQARLDDTDFDGEKLNEESFGSGQAETGDDLDMDLVEENKNEAIGEGDEENQYWSSSDNNDEDVSEGA